MERKTANTSASRGAGSLNDVTREGEVLAWRLARARLAAAFERQDNAAAMQLRHLWAAGAAARKKNSQRRLALLERQLVRERDRIVASQTHSLHGFGEDLRRVRQCLAGMGQASSDVLSWLPASRLRPVSASVVRNHLQAAHAAIEPSATRMSDEFSRTRQLAGSMANAERLAADATRELQRTRLLLQQLRSRELLERSIRIHMMQVQGLA